MVVLSSKFDRYCNGCNRRRNSCSNGCSDCSTTLVLPLCFSSTGRLSFLFVDSGTSWQIVRVFGWTGAESQCQLQCTHRSAPLRLLRPKILRHRSAAARRISAGIATVLLKVVVSLVLGDSPKSNFDSIQFDSIHCCCITRD